MTPISARMLVVATGCALSAASAVMLIGCGQDQTAAAVVDARIQMETVAGGTAKTDDAQAASAIYAQIEAALTAAKGRGSAGADEAAAVVIGSSRQGQAATMGEAAQSESFAVRERLTVLSSQTSVWTRASARAEAAESVDVSAEVAEIDRLAGARRDEAARLGAQKSQIDARMADLTAQVENLLARAKRERNEAGRLTLELPRLPASAAPGQAERIRGHTLEGDRLDAEAAKLQFELGRIGPEARELAAGVQRVATQIELLTRQKAEANAKADAARAEARAAREQAAAVLERIKADAGTLADLIDGSFTTSFDAMTRQSQSAAQSAGEARTTADVEGAIAGALAQQQLGQGQRDRAGTLALAAEVYRGLANAGAMPQAAEVAERLQARAQEAQDASATAYNAAASAFKRVRSRVPRDLSERLGQLGDVLERLAGAGLNEVANLAEPTPEPEPQPEAATEAETEVMDGPSTDGPSEAPSQEPSTDGPSTDGPSTVPDAEP